MTATLPPDDADRWLTDAERKAKKKAAKKAAKQATKDRANRQRQMRSRRRK